MRRIANGSVRQMYGTATAKRAKDGSPDQLMGLSISLSVNRIRFRKPESKLYMNDQIKPLAMGGTA